MSPSDWQPAGAGTSSIDNPEICSGTLRASMKSNPILAKADLGAVRRVESSYACNDENLEGDRCAKILLGLCASYCTVYCIRWYPPVDSGYPSDLVLWRVKIYSLLMTKKIWRTSWPPLCPVLRFIRTRSSRRQWSNRSQTTLLSCSSCMSRNDGNVPGCQRPCHVPMNSQQSWIFLMLQSGRGATLWFVGFIGPNNLCNRPSGRFSIGTTKQSTCGHTW